ncbi:MAG: hypothetical protein DRI89_07895 [Bacteroidetes bacterium]|nr:MAG: hypothetical protein DRI89_07895 [Bacteroidota bacterium]
MKNIEKIKLAREIKGISQEYMAISLNVSQSTYSRYESGAIKLSLETINSILMILNISQLDLILLNADSIFTKRDTVFARV